MVHCQERLQLVASAKEDYIELLVDYLEFQGRVGMVRKYLRALSHPMGFFAIRPTAHRIRAEF